MILMILLGSILIGCLIGLFKWLWSRRKLYLLSWKLDGPFALPFVGNGLSLIGKENVLYMDNMCKENKTPIRVWLGTRFMIYITEPEDLEIILNSPNCMNREVSYSSLADALGVNGIFTLDGALWKRHRKLVGPSFNYYSVIGHLGVFNKNCEILVEKLANYVDGGPFDVRMLVSACTLDSFFEATLGSDIDDEKKRLYTHYITDGQALVAKRLFNPFYHLNFVWNNSTACKLIKKYQNYSLNLLDEIINRKLKEGSSEMTFIDKMIRVAEENDDFGMIDVKAECTNALTAATDTSALTISFTLLMLAMHTAHQDNVFKEVKSIFESQNDRIERYHIEKMHYTERCIQETLRLFPPVSVIARECHDGKIHLRNCDIEPGMSIGIGIRQVHRNEKYWGQDALQYNPDRFLPELVEERNPYIYIPFSAGQRNCVGWRYSMIVMKSIVANIIRNYEINTDLKMNELRMRMDVNLFLYNKHMVYIKQRNFNA